MHAKPHNQDANQTGRAGVHRRTQLALDLRHEEARSEADFMISEDNQVAFDHVCAWPAWTTPLTLIEGPAKSGKSHLARIWTERAGAEVATPDTLAEIAAEGGTAPVLIEDVDRQGYDEASLFHLLNQSMRSERAVLMTAREGVAFWPLSTNDVRSRARLAARFTIAAPDDILLSQMMVKLFADRQVSVAPKVISYLVARMERSSEEAVALAALVDRLALEQRKPVTRAVAAQALELRAAEREQD